MQLKNNNPVPMEKRTDLASLFCMIGRHGPAVAVAVIAMVSVVAGFIIYRTVKGKRRKAEAGPGDVGGSSSHGALGEELLQPEQEALSPVESTDVSGTVSNAKDATVIRSRRKLKNRAAAERTPQSSSPPKREVEPEKLCNPSHVEETSSFIQTDIEEAMERLQDDTCEVTDLNLTDEGNNCNLVKTTKDAEDDCSDFLEPVMVCESLGNEEKVKRSKEDEVSTDDASTEMPCKEKKNVLALNSPVCQVENASSLNENEQSDQATTDSINTGSFSEEPSIHMNESLQSTKNGDEISILDIAGLNKPHLVHKDFENVTLHKHIDDQLMTFTNQTVPAIRSVDADQSHNGEITENMLDNLGDSSANWPVMLPGKEQEGSTCSKEHVEYDKQSSLYEPPETSVLVFPHVLPCLPVEQETIQKDHSPTQVNLQPEDKIKDDVTPELAKETSDALLGLACQGEVETASNVIPKENESSPDGEPDAVVGIEVSSDASLSTDMSCPDESAFQNQENVQIQNAEDHLEVPTAPALVMAESMEPQIEDKLLYENSSNLTLCSLDVGEESGISSMTVTPDLPDAGEFLASENVLLPVMDAHPKSEDQAELKTTEMANSQTVINKEPTNLVSDSSNDLQPINDYTDKADDSCSISEMHHEIEGFNKTVDQPVEAPTSFCLNEDLGKMGTKIIEGKCEEVKEEDKTEINIMEATMDNNEWLTDGTDQVLPWMKHSVPQINIVSEHFQTSCPGDAVCTNADVPLVSESEETNMIPSEATETGKRVLAVQPLPQNVSVTFQIHYLTHSPYQKVAITGNHWELGNWKDFVPLEKAKDGFWATVVSLPAESHVEWKFVIVDRGQVCRWEECGNRLLDTGNKENLLVHKCWGFL